MPVPGEAETGAHPGALFALPGTWMDDMPAFTPAEAQLLNDALTRWAHHMPARRAEVIAFAQTHNLPLVVDIDEPTPEEDR